MSETSKLEKFAEIKYFLLIISFTLLLDIYLLYNSDINVTKLKMNYLKENLGTFLIFLCLFSFYITILTKFIITLFTMLFEIFKIKKNINKYNIEYYKLLTKSFVENNSVMYKYSQDKIKEEKNIFEGITLYYGMIVLFIFDLTYHNDSIIRLLVNKFYCLLQIDNTVLSMFALIIAFITILLMTVFPIILLKDYISEKNLIRINNLIKQNILNKKYK